MKTIKKIAVMTSGGDAPGMNAAIRAVVRQSIFSGLNIAAIQNGFEGLINGEFMPMNAHSVSNIIQRGGTILSTSRSKRFIQEKWQKIAYQNLKNNAIDALIIIGGNGSIEGAKIFSTKFKIPVITIPKTIDNDVASTDYSIGFDTACNTAMEAIDKIRDTADAHHRLFFIEVMGRDRGFIALNAGLSSGAEAILIPEVKSSIEDLLDQLEKGWERHKSSIIVVVAEGCIKGGLQELVNKVKARFDHFEIKTTILGHIQRGGAPSSFDRVLATRLGSAAVTGLLNGKANCIVGMIGNQVVFTPLGKENKQHLIDVELVKLIKELSC